MDWNAQVIFYILNSLNVRLNGEHIILTLLMFCIILFIYNEKLIALILSSNDSECIVRCHFWPYWFTLVGYCSVFFLLMISDAENSTASYNLRQNKILLNDIEEIYILFFKKKYWITKNSIYSSKIVEDRKIILKIFQVLKTRWARWTWMNKISWIQTHSFNEFQIEIKMVKVHERSAKKWV